jgi:hypothetical protein
MVSRESFIVVYTMSNRKHGTPWKYGLSGLSGTSIAALFS